jgi:HD-GYP domain-containing protein (c-di-GMP phosphodiesterase class II)
MCSDRPYRAALPFSAAREEIVRWSGLQFDPEVVKAFLSMPESIWDHLRNRVEAHVYQFYSEETAAAQGA